MFSRGLVPLSLLTVALLVGGFALVVLLRAQRRRPGLRAEDLLPARAAGDRRAVRLRGRRGLRDPLPAHAATARDDLRSYVAIHLSLILAVGVLITGSIWAKASWGHWWVWDEPMLVSFLIVFLLYATATSRCASRSRTPSARRATPPCSRSSAGAFVPLNFMAVRMAESLRAPARARHHGRRDARRDAADVPRLRSPAWRCCS